MKYVNLGCGRRFIRDGDWVNYDFSSSDPAVKAHNLREGIPQPDNSADLVYSSHVLEHFSKKEAAFFLSECKRVLKPGGILRIAVPDLENIARAYIKSLEEARAGIAGAADRHDWMIIELLDQMVREYSGGEMYEYLVQKTVPEKEFILKRLGLEAKNIIDGAAQGSSASQGAAVRQGGIMESLKKLTRPASKAQDPDAAAAAFRKSGEVHRWMYDEQSLKKIIVNAGFKEVVKRGASESYIKGWAGFNLDTEPDGSFYKPDSLFMEGRKI